MKLPKINYEKFAEDVLRRRAEMRLSIRQLEAVCGVSYPIICRIEAEKHYPSLSQWYALIFALELNPTDYVSNPLDEIPPVPTDEIHPFFLVGIEGE